MWSQQIGKVSDRCAVLSLHLAACELFISGPLFLFVPFSPRTTFECDAYMFALKLEDRFYIETCASKYLFLRAI